MAQPMTDNTPSFLQLTAPAGPWSKGYDGEDVIVGVIDAGIWPEHPASWMTVPTPTWVLASMTRLIPPVILATPAITLLMRLYLQQQAARRTPDAGYLPHAHWCGADEFDSLATTTVTVRTPHRHQPEMQM